MGEKLLVTTNTVWILGAGASFDCINPDRSCVPITSSLLADHELPASLEDGLHKLSMLDDTARLEPLPTLLGRELETTIDRVRRLCEHPDRLVAQTAIECLKEITTCVASAIRRHQVQSLFLGTGGGVGFVYAAENYFLLASLTSWSPGWSVVTLNYDTILDRAFEEIATLYDDEGVMEPLIKGFMGLPDAAPSGKPLQYYKWRKLLSDHMAGLGPSELKEGVYLKLHGSLDLFSCHNCECTQYRRPHLARRDVNIWTEGIIEHITAREEQCNLCESKMVELILPPGKNKMEGEKEYHEATYREAERVLGEANCWVLIGYSFPEYDTDILGLLRRALKKTALYSNPTRAVWVVSPDAENVARRAQELLDYPVGAIPEEFSSFATNLGHLINETRPFLPFNKRT